MKIGILGTGDVGRTLANAFIATGHEVKMGSREAANGKTAAWLKQAGPRSSADAFAGAAKFAEVAVIATAWSGTESALRMAGIENFAGKIVIDATNPLKFTAGRPPELARGHTDSGGEQVQRWLPSARVVKAFNTVGYGMMFKPDLPGGPPDMFICGNDDAAKTAVAELLKSFGWETIDIGGIDGARLLEPLCMLWLSYAMRTGTRTHAFKLVRITGQGV